MKPEAIVRVGALYLAVSAVALVWSTPFIWMVVASFRPQNFGGLDMASLVPTFAPTLANFRLALESADFPTYYLNTAIIVLGTLAVQLVTVTLAGYVFARLEFPGRDALFTLFLLQLMIVPPVLIVPNLQTIADLGLYDSLVAVMLPYFASGFGTFLLRQTFRTIPRDYEEAALIDGCSWYQLLWHVLVPLARPALVAFSIVSIVAHWNEFLWPLMVINSPDKRPVTVGLASFVLGAEGGSEWGLVAAGAMLVMGPLLLAFFLFQKQFVKSFMSTGIK